MPKSLPTFFTLLQIMQKAEQAYIPLGPFPYNHKTGQPIKRLSSPGDGLAVFIVREIADLAASRRISLENLWEIIRGLERARDDIEHVLNGLLELTHAATPSTVPKKTVAASELNEPPAERKP